MRKAVIGLCAVLVLGCAGLQEAIEQAASVEMDVKSGADAVHPADFPLSQPPTGTIANSTDISMKSMKTRAVVYELPGDADATALLDTYEQEIRSLGFEPDRSATRVAVQSDGGKVIAAEIAAAGEKSVLTLTEVSVDLEEPPVE